jgi:hypothetical protein
MPTSALEAFGGLTGRLVWLGLLHSVWIGLLVGSGVALIFQIGPRITHGARHAILLVAMLIASAGPIAMAIAQHLSSSPTERGAAEIAGTLLSFRVEARGEAPSSRSDASASRPALAVGRPGSRFASVAGILARVVDGLRMARAVAAAVWSAVVASLCAILALGGIGLRRLCRDARPAPTAIRDRSRRLARLLRLRRIPRVLVHPGLAEPFLFGVFRPAIVLPRKWVAGARPGWLEAVLAHELAHARRLDQLANLAQRLVEVGLFFHPAVHWLARSLRRERELCADALAVRLTGDPLALAEALQSVARLRHTSPRSPAVAASLGGPSVSLLPRIQELIGMTPLRPRFTLWPLAALPAAGFLALIATAAGLAEDRPSPTATPPQAVAGEDHLPVGRPASRQVRSIDLVNPLRDRADSAPHLVVDFAQGNVADDRQIAYEVRYIVSNEGAWRQPLLDRLKLIKQEADVAAWTLDDKALLDLLTRAQGDTKTNVLQAPKVTSFSGARATIINRRKQHYVAGVEKLEYAARPAFRPIVKELQIGGKLDMTGTIVPGGTRLSVSLSDSWLLALRTMGCEHRVGAEVHPAQYQIPTMIDRRCELTCDLPEGTHLLISLGLSDEPRKPTGLAGLANGAFAAIGLPEPIRFVPFERLVLITPRPIILESDEQPIRPASHVRAKSKSRRAVSRLTLEVPRP